MAQIFGFFPRNAVTLNRAEIDQVVARLCFGRLPPENERRLVHEGGLLVWSGNGAPETAEENGVSSVVEGWIFNRDDLAPAANDAAVVLALYRKEGFEGALSRINGDFGLALLDRKAGVLWLARDRLGLQPLYYVERPGFIAFASRPRPLLGLAGVERRPDPSFIARFAGSHYRSFDNDPARWSRKAAGSLVHRSVCRLALPQL